MAVSIRELARSCGVSSATVSRVFNKHPRVRSETRERVLRMAHELGYAPQLTARQDCIAVVVEGYEAIDLTGYSGMLMAALSREVFQRGYQLDIIRPADIPLLRGRFVSGVLACVYAPESLALVAGLRGVATVTVNARVDGKPAVLSNDRQGLSCAVDLLAQHGHSRIALLRSSAQTLNNREREAGFAQAMAERRLEPGFVLRSGGRGVVEDVAKILRQDATAIIGTGEELGTALGYALQLLDRRVPRDVSTVTFEHPGVSCYAFPPKTTLEQDFRGLAAAALDCLERPDARDGGATQVDYRLIERESVGPVA